MIAGIAPPPDVVARTIVTAVESRRPLQRYLIGVDAVAIASLETVLPRSVTDALMRFAGKL